jgi:8-oxo-dGTP pyrophosphatase MutT (NUDIX family)
VRDLRDRALLRHRLRLPIPAPVAAPEPARMMAGPRAIGAPLASSDGVDLGGANLVPAAVLVSLVLGAEPGVLLTKRTAHLAKHPGQVSFPGGRMDPGDASPEDAALREAQEEVGLAPGDVELLGRLDDYVTGTGYCVTPVLGLLPQGMELADLRLVPSPDEVAHVFALPLSVLLDPAAPQRRRAHFRGAWREFWVWPHPDHYIWGATAAMLVHLAHRLRGG